MLALKTSLPRQRSHISGHSTILFRVPSGMPSKYLFANDSNGCQVIKLNSFVSSNIFIHLFKFCCEYQKLFVVLTIGTKYLLLSIHLLVLSS